MNVTFSVADVVRTEYRLQPAIQEYLHFDEVKKVATSSLEK